MRTICLWKLHWCTEIASVSCDSPDYSLTVIQPWRVILGPTEFCTTLLLFKASKRLSHVSLVELSIPYCRLPWVFFKRRLSRMLGTAWRTIHFAKTRGRFRLSDAKIMWSWQHRLCIWSLLSEIRNLAFAALTWMVDLWNSRRTVFVEIRSSKWISISAATCIAVVLSNPLQCTAVSYYQCWFSSHFFFFLILSSRICRRHNLRSCRPLYTHYCGKYCHRCSS